ncbi:TPA: hypothetical protein ACXI1P_000935, partial [Stenotrophomonas maltophilia]
PAPPSTDSRDLSGRRCVLLLVGVDLGRHGRSTPCVDESLSGIEKRMESELFSNEKGFPREQH